jgi:hypothetical protein
MRLGSVLGAIGLATFKAEIRAAGRRMAIAALSGLLLATGVCFAVAAFAVWLAGEIGTVGALLSLAGGFVVLALIVHGVARLAAGRPRKRAPPPTPEAAPAAAQSAAEAPSPGSEIGAVAIVALLGFLLARQMLER